MSPVGDILGLAEKIITERWPCFCPDSYLRSHFYIPECPRHTLGPDLIHELTEHETRGGTGGS